MMRRTGLPNAPWKLSSSHFNEINQLVSQVSLRITSSILSKRKQQKAQKSNKELENKQAMQQPKAIYNTVSHVADFTCDETQMF